MKSPQPAQRLHTLPLRCQYTLKHIGANLGYPPLPYLSSAGQLQRGAGTRSLSGLTLRPAPLSKHNEAHGCSCFTVQPLGPQFQRMKLSGCRKPNAPVCSASTTTGVPLKQLATALLTSRQSPITTQESSQIIPSVLPPSPERVSRQGCVKASRNCLTCN